MPSDLSASQLSQDPNWDNDGVLDEEPDAEQPDFNVESVRSVVNAASESITHNVVSLFVFKFMIVVFMKKYAVVSS